MIVCFSKSYETSHFDALAGGAIEALASWRQHAGGATGMTLTANHSMRHQSALATSHGNESSPRSISADAGDGRAALTDARRPVVQAGILKCPAMFKELANRSLQSAARLLRELAILAANNDFENSDSEFEGRRECI